MSAQPAATKGDGGDSRGGGSATLEGGEGRGSMLRTLGLTVAVLLAFVVLWPTLRAYVAQQEQLRDLNAELASTNAQVSALEAELARWDDPEYVKAQARDRFSYVAPGETAYRVIDPETVTGEDPMADLAAQADARSPYEPSQTDPWYVSVWGSVQIAGAAADALAAERESATDRAATDPAATDGAAIDPAASDPAATDSAASAGP